MIRYALTAECEGKNMGNNEIVSGQEAKKGKITQIIGAVLDIKFPKGSLPNINDAVRIPVGQDGELVAEVSKHQGDGVVRCIAMGPTDGLRRGVEAEAAGSPITVPVGEETLGRMFNVLGQPIDGGRKRRRVSPVCRSTGILRPLRSSPQPRKSWRQASRWWICSVLTRKGEKSVCSAEPVWERPC